MSSRRTSSTTTATRLAIAISLVAASSTAACGTAKDPAADDDGAAKAGSLSLAFAASAREAGVPRDLLVAIARVEDGLELPRVRPKLDVDNEVPAAGPLQLRRGKLDTLARGAKLSGHTELELRTDADLALAAGARVLAELARESGARSDDLTSYAHAIEEMSGFADDAHREHYVHQVFATLARGGAFSARDGETVTLAQHEIPPTLTLDVSSKIRALAGAEYPGAEYFPTSCTDKCTPGRDGNPVEFVLVHDTEGNWNASVATLQNDPGKSVQYIIDVDGRVGQFVPENTTAYHAGNFHYNQRSVGIEHVGYATKPFPEALYVASGKLVDHLATKYGIARDRAHVIGHDQVPNGNRIAKESKPCSDAPKQCQSNLSYGGASHHTDPGIWEWPTFMTRFGGNAKCNDVTERLTCSNDKTKAFRCAGGSVEVQTCDGTGACQPSESDADDVCNIAPKAAPPPAGGKEAPPPPKDPASTVVETKDPPVAEESGCAVGATSRRADTFSFVGLALGIAAILRRRVHHRDGRASDA